MNILEYIIKAKDESGAGTASAGNKIKSLGGELLSAAGIALSLGGVFKIFSDGLKRAFETQLITARLATFVGGMEKAKKVMAELSDWKDRVAGGLFDQSDIAKATINLEKLSNGALRSRNMLDLVGNVAAATGNNMETTSFAIAKAFGNISQGLPIDRAAMQLEQLGIISPDVIKKLKELSENGGSMAQQWNILRTELEKCNGALDNLKNTDAGKIKANVETAKENIETSSGWVAGKIMAGGRSAGRLAFGEPEESNEKDLDPNGITRLNKAARLAIEREAALKREADILAAAQKDQDKEIGKIHALRRANADVKSNEVVIQNTQKNLDKWGGLGGFGRFASDPSMQLPGSTADAFRRQGESKAYRAALDRTSLRAGETGHTGDTRESYILKAMSERVRGVGPFKALDAQGFEDKAATKLGQKIAEGKRLSATELASMDPRLVEDAQAQREKRLKARVDSGGKLSREDFEFMEQRKTWKQALEDQKKQQMQADNDRNKAQQKIDAANKAKQDALDKIAANTDKLPELLAAE